MPSALRISLSAVYRKVFGMAILNFSRSDLELMVGRGEKILWRGKPNKRGFILEGVFNPLLPFSIVWGLFDFFFILVSQGNPLVLGFILFHMMPVWIYLAGVIFVFRKYNYTEYIITDKAVYISGGLFSYTCNMKPFAELNKINIRRGVIDQMLGVGDIVFVGAGSGDVIYTTNGAASSMNLVIEDIADYQRVFNLVKDLQIDVYSDTMYPNELRPEANRGYKTKYTGRGPLDI